MRALMYQIRRKLAGFQYNLVHCRFAEVGQSNLSLLCFCYTSFFNQEEEKSPKEAMTRTSLYRQHSVSFPRPRSIPSPSQTA